MRGVVTRVSEASVSIHGKTLSQMGKGLLLLLGAEKGDGPKDAQYIAEKVLGLRVFEDADGKMNLDLAQADGEMMVVSQFTLLGDARKGRRPSFFAAELPKTAKELYEMVIRLLQEKGAIVHVGQFQADMQVQSINDGPVTILLDSRKLF